MTVQQNKNKKQLRAACQTCLASFSSNELQDLCIDARDGDTSMQASHCSAHQQLVAQGPLDQVLAMSLSSRSRSCSTFEVRIDIR